MIFDVGVFSGVTASIVAVGGLAVTLYRTRSDRKQGVAATESEARRDTIADRDSLVQTFREELRDTRKRVTNLEREMELEKQWTQMLRDHIYRQKPPPPPERPTRPSISN